MEYIKSLFAQGQALGKEYLGIGLALLLFLVFPQVVRLWDASAAAIDPGALSAVLMAILAVLIFKLVTWWLIRTIWPALATYSGFHFELNFKSLEPWQKVVIYLGFYLVLLYSFVAVLGALV